MFTIQDLLLFLGEPLEEKPKYTMASAGVLSHIEAVYHIGIGLSTNTLVKKTYDGTTIYLEESPIISVNSVKVGDTELEFTYLNNTITLPTTYDIGTNFTVDITYGYENVPYDLKMAIYAHIQAVVFSSKENTNSVSKVVNSTGNTVFYRESSIPKESSIVYAFYSKRQVIN